jgi:hypothetical protein
LQYEEIALQKEGVLQAALLLSIGKERFMKDEIMQEPETHNQIMFFF